MFNNETFKDIYNAIDVMEATIKEQRAEIKRLTAELKTALAERDAALAVVNEFIIDTTVNNKTPIHECEFVTDPEKGKCDKCEAWGNYVGLFCSTEDEEETQ